MDNENMDKEGIEPIYDGDLDFETIKKKPILKPILEINKSYVNFELLIKRALWEYTQDKEAIDKMIELNPKYSETMILSKIQSILGHIKQIIHSQNIEKEDMKSVINEMIKIAEQNYALLEDEFEEKKPKIVKEIIEKKIETEEEKKKDEITEQKEEEEKPEKFYSDLLEKEISTPNENKKEFISISKNEK